MLFLASLVVSTALICAVLTAGMLRLAVAWRWVDAPDGHRKLQPKAVPLGGGVALAAACGLAITYVAFGGTAIGADLASEPQFVYGFLGAAGLIIVIGWLDDTYELRGRHKLLAQIAASLLVVSTGLIIQHVSVFGGTLDLGLLAVPFTVAWLVGAINAFNLIDGLDGLAGSIGVIIATTIGLLALFAGRPLEAALCAILLGGTLGFLVFNWHPARIYLGDVGSMLLGLVLGVLAIRVSFKSTTTLGIAVPIVVWAVLFFDVVMAILRRRLTGRSIYASDRAHLHHALQQQGLSVPQAVGLIAGACAVCCLGGVAGALTRSDLVAVAPAALVLVSLVATGRFGRTELVLGLRWIADCLAAWGRIGRRRPLPDRSGLVTWTQPGDDLLQELAEYADRFHLCSIRLDLNGLAAPQPERVLWESASMVEPQRMWRAELPLYAGPQPAGRLTVCGQRQPGERLEDMCDLLHGMQPLLTQWESLQHLSLDSSDLTEDPSAPRFDEAHPLAGLPMHSAATSFIR